MTESYKEKKNLQVHFFNLQVHFAFVHFSTLDFQLHLDVHSDLNFETVDSTSFLSTLDYSNLSQAYHACWAATFAAMVKTGHHSYSSTARQVAMATADDGHHSHLAAVRNSAMVYHPPSDSRQIYQEMVAQTNWAATLASRSASVNWSATSHLDPSAVITGDQQIHQSLDYSTTVKTMEIHLAEHLPIDSVSTAQYLLLQRCWSYLTAVLRVEQETQAFH
mmetsp:Transcript_1111/g.2142  ORF Transcript_1111/g.2142 Transcript_1111/m.2142 type:complete len:220 (+) Transcript_1111:154-813(+)